MVVPQVTQLRGGVRVRASGAGHGATRRGVAEEHPIRRPVDGDHDPAGWLAVRQPTHDFAAEAVGVDVGTAKRPQQPALKDAAGAALTVGADLEQHPSSAKAVNPPLGEGIRLTRQEAGGQVPDSASRATVASPFDRDPAVLAARVRQHGHCLPDLGVRSRWRVNPPPGEWGDLPGSSQKRFASTASTTSYTSVVEPTSISATTALSTCMDANFGGNSDRSNPMINRMRTQQAVLKLGCAAASADEIHCATIK